MNYKAELRGFSLDRASKLKEMDHGIDVFEMSDKIVEYLYIPEKDIDSHLQTLLPLLRESGNTNKLDALILALEQMKAELEAGGTVQ